MHTHKIYVDLFSDPFLSFGECDKASGIRPKDRSLFEGHFFWRKFDRLKENFLNLGGGWAILRKLHKKLQLFYYTSHITNRTFGKIFR